MLRAEGKLITKFPHRRSPSLLNVSDGCFRESFPPATGFCLSNKRYVLTGVLGRNPLAPLRFL